MNFRRSPAFGAAILLDGLCVFLISWIVWLCVWNLLLDPQLYEAKKTKSSEISTPQPDHKSYDSNEMSNEGTLRQPPETPSGAHNQQPKNL